MTPKNLAAIFACPLERTVKWHPHIAAAMDRFEIDTPLRAAAFLAQIGHESGGLRYVRELWDPDRCPWQAKYEGRADLGNTQPGDGSLFRGRGLIQITGRANYRACGLALGLDLEIHPELLEQHEWASFSAGWFWREHKLNLFADQRDMHVITKKINGGYNGLAPRLALYEAAKKELRA